MNLHNYVVLLSVCIVIRTEGFWLWGNDKNKIDGKWSEWSNYSSCHLPTGKEIFPYRSRTRNCNNPAAKGGGKQCKGQALRKAPCSDCDSALGIESRVITDSQISASTFHEEFPAKNARLNGPSAWCAKDLTGELFLQVDFKSLTLVTAIATQGYFPDSKELSLRLGSVSKYQITYSDDGITFEVYQNSEKNKVFIGNGNNLKTVLNTFDPQIAAKHIRIHPTAYIKFVCMKFEMYGCSFKCGGYLPQTPGDLLAVSSESEDVDCFWQVHFPKSQKINFDFIDFKLPCKYGHVDVRGSNPYYGGAQRLGDFCDYTSAPPPIESNGNKLWIRFQSNSSNPLVGFYGIYFPNCDTFLNSTKGTISTPNYPSLYNHNSKCTWSITVPKGKVVMLEFLDIDIEEDPACNNDYVAVLDSNSSTIGQYCNSNKPPRLICSNENTMKLHFKSDDVLALKGFQATYTAIDANAPCMEPSSTIITPTPTISIPTSVASMNYTPSPTIVTIKPTTVVGLSPTLMRNGSIGVLATGTGVQSTGLGNLPSNKKDDDGEDTGLSTIIIIAVFSFIVLCMIIASVVPSMIHGYDKRKRERKWTLAAKKNTCVENEYEMQPIKTQGDKKDEPNEETAFLDPEDPCFDEQETVLFLPITPQENHETSTPCNRTIIEADDETETYADGPVAEDLGCELEYDTTDLNLSVSYEDLGSSFATEMAALMSNYDYISPNPKQDPSECGVLQETNEDLESCTDTEVLQEDQETRNIQPTKETKKETSDTKEKDKSQKDEPNNQESADPLTDFDDKNGKLQKALSDLKATLSQINSDSDSIPEIDNPETCTNSTASVRGSQDMPSIPSVWEKNIASGDDSSNPRRTRNSGELDVSKASNDGAQNHGPGLEVNKDSGHSSSNSDYDQVPNIPNYSLASIATETCV